MHVLAKSLSLAGLIAGTSLGFTACGTLTGQSNDLLARDMAEMKQRLNEYVEQEAANERKFEYTLSKLDESIQSRNEMTKNAVDDLEKRVRELIDSQTQLRQQVESLQFSVSSNRNRSELGATAGTSDVGPSPVTGTDPSINAPMDTGAAGGTAVDQAILSSLNLFNLGRFAEAREGFQQALALNPTGDKRIEVLFGLGESAYNLEDHAAAVDAYRQLIQQNPTHQKAWVSLDRMATIKLAQGDRETAAKLLQQFDSNPDYPNMAHIQQLRAQLAQ